MKKYTIVMVLLVTAFVIGSLSSCDNRSQMEKDMDSAAKKAGDLLKWSVSKVMRSTETRLIHSRVSIDVYSSLAIVMSLFLTMFLSYKLYTEYMSNEYKLLDIVFYAASIIISILSSIFLMIIEKRKNHISVEDYL